MHNISFCKITSIKYPTPKTKSQGGDDHRTRTILQKKQSPSKSSSTKKGTNFEAKTQMKKSPYTWLRINSYLEDHKAWDLWKTSRTSFAPFVWKEGLSATGVTKPRGKKRRKKGGWGGGVRGIYFFCLIRLGCGPSSTSLGQWGVWDTIGKNSYRWPHFSATIPSQPCFWPSEFLCSGVGG